MGEVLHVRKVSKNMTLVFLHSSEEVVAVPDLVSHETI